jgi:hypothetical protein
MYDYDRRAAGKATPPKPGDVATFFQGWDPVRRRGDGQLALVKVERVYADRGVGAAIGGELLTGPNAGKFMVSFSLAQLAQNYGKVTPQHLEGLRLRFASSVRAARRH